RIGLAAVFPNKLLVLIISFLVLQNKVRFHDQRGQKSPLLLLKNLVEDKIIGIVNKAIEGKDDLFMVDVKVKGNEGNQKVLVFVDGDNGISIDECGRISRYLGAELEETDLFSGKYTLEVSSPGLDFPLSLLRQYVKNIGRELSVETNEGEKVEGKLKQVDNENIILATRQSDMVLNFEEIKQSKVKVSFK
ncbi:MAG: hypothetical protein AAF391_04595, partial [Bacteroidota bacterium]